MRVAVVGAGIAGLSAATALVGGGASVTLFDKGRGPAGRTSTRRAADVAFDHGAPWIEAEDEAFVAQLGSWAAAGCAARWTPRVARLDDEGRVDGVDTHDVWLGVPGMSALAKSSAAALDLRSGVRVSAITHDDAGWTVTAESGERFGPFDALVSTPPPEQSAALLRTAGLERLASDADDVPMAPCVVVMLAFPTAIDAPFDAAHLVDDELAWICRETSKPGRAPGEAWTLQATPSWSAEHFDDDDALLADALLRAWNRVYAVDAPPPRHIDVHRWRYAGAPFPLDGPLVDDARGLVVCGDWTHARAGVEGAWLAGRDAAARLLAR